MVANTRRWRLVRSINWLNRPFPVTRAHTAGLTLGRTRRAGARR